MSETSDDLIRVGDPLPTIAHVGKANGRYGLSVIWVSGRRHGEEVIDLAPHIFAFKVYKPLREDADLFARASVSEDGTAVIWPGSADLEVSTDVLEELAEDVMTSAQFSQSLRDLGLTFDAAAAQLGISRRLVAYYTKEREVPRYIALACEALKARAAATQQPRPAIDLFARLAEDIASIIKTGGGVLPVADVTAGELISSANTGRLSVGGQNYVLMKESDLPIGLITAG